MSSQQRQPAEMITVVPRHIQCLPEEDKNNEMLDSYNQRQFGGTIPDERITLEEHITDLSRDLPAMLLRDGSYPVCALDNCPMVDIIDGVGLTNDDPTNDRKSLNSVQAA